MIAVNRRSLGIGLLAGVAAVGACAPRYIGQPATVHAQGVADAAALCAEDPECPDHIADALSELELDARCLAMASRGERCALHD